jgi:two-component system LytT family response regulator
VIRALLVDDEPLARRGLRVRLEREGDVDIVGEADDGPSAVEAIRRLAPDLVFLDVQMPGLDGFQVLEQVWGERPPHVVFVTAHDAHALKAFEFHALDYLLKPYSEERFLEALRRARVQIAQRATSAEQRQLEALLESLAAARGAGGASGASGRGPYAQRFSVRDRERIVFVRAEELDAVLAAGNYVELVVGAKKHLMRVTLAEMEVELDPARFARIHRSTIVNMDRVEEVRPDAHGDGEVVLTGGGAYRMSRAYRERLLPGGRGQS